MNEKELKINIDRLLENANNKGAAKEALMFLFATIRGAGGLNPAITDGQDRPYLKHRISKRDYADNYFQLDPQPNSWGRSELSRIIDLENPSEQLSSLESRLNSLSSEDQVFARRQIFNSLEEIFTTERKLTPGWLIAIIEMSKYYIKKIDEGKRFIYRTTNEERFRFLIVRALRSFTPEEKGKLFIEVLEKVEEISLLCDVFRGEAGDTIAGGVTDRGPNSFGSETEQIRDLLLIRVTGAAASGAIWRQAMPGHLLWFWWGSVGPSQVLDFTSRTMASAEGLGHLFDLPIGTVSSTSGDYEHVQPTWSKIVDLERLAECARTTIADSPDPELKSRAQRFLAAFEKGKDSPFR